MSLFIFLYFFQNEKKIETKKKVTRKNTENSTCEAPLLLPVVQVVWLEHPLIVFSSHFPVDPHQPHSVSRMQSVQVLT
jgi:hypothetical protein